MSRMIVVLVFALASVSLAACNSAESAGCITPGREFHDFMESVRKSEFDLHSFRAVELSERWGGGPMTWIIAAWPEIEPYNTEPIFENIAVWTAESIDPPMNVQSADPWAGFSTDLPAHDLATQMDLLDARAITRPINCTLEALGAD